MFRVVRAVFGLGLPGLVVSLAFAAPPQVKTEAGKLQGVYNEKPKVYAFKGIPYALPPIGDLRWAQPQPAAHWKGKRQAVEFAPRCMQALVFPDMIFRDKGPSENCLYLNVWTPSLSRSAHLPVMFWIHGGGFTAGSSSEPRQDGENLAKRGVIVVSLNYRLNIFGFFAHPELSQASTPHASGNYGLLDMVAALQWVQANIAAFGGDPGNVTIFGESAGSWSVSQLIASPLALKLFSRAIGESGGSFSNTSLAVLPLAEVEKQNVKFVESIGASNLTALRAMPADQLLQAAMKAGQVRFTPIIDGYFLPEAVPAIYAAGEQNHVPLLAGWNANEGGSAAQQKATVESFTAEAQKTYGDKAGDFLKVYPAGSNEGAKESAAALAGDRFIAFATWRWIEAQVATGQSPVYRYRFNHLLPPPEDEHGAYHSAEIEFVFDDLKYKDLKWRETDRQLADLMASYWTNFAKHGDPNGPNLPKWPAFNGPEARQVMLLDIPAQAVLEENRGRYQFFDSTQPK